MTNRRLGSIGHGRLLAAGVSVLAAHPWATAAALSAALVSSLAIGTGSGYVFTGLASTETLIVEPGDRDARAAALRRADLHAHLQALRAKLGRTEPRGYYIVVDQTHNRLYLRKGQDTILLAVCSAGSGATLTEPGGHRRWTFATPRGRFEVLERIRNPVWKKPDWAFIEDAQPIPADPSQRFEYGALGEFGLDFGDGYLIHGTLYERLLGRSVTHGCIRLGRDDLRTVYAAARRGTPIYIY